jgi:TolB protein
VPRNRAALAVSAVLAGLAVAGSGSGAVSPARNARIAYAHLGAGADVAQIWTRTATGARRRRLTTGRFSSFAPSYSPTGRQIVFVRAFKQGDLWTMRADGSHKRRLTWTRRIDELAPAWSADGKQIAFAVDRPKTLEGIWIIGANGHGRSRLTTGSDSHPTWSPDGSQIAFQRYDASAQTDAVLVIPASGGSPTDLTGDPSVSDLDPSWSPNGGRILFSSDRGGGNQLDLWVMNPNGSDVERVTDTPSRDERSPVWSPDGQRIVYSGSGAFHGASSSQIYVSRTNGTNRRVITHACGECAVVNDYPSWQPLR